MPMPVEATSTRCHFSNCSFRSMFIPGTVTLTPSPAKNAAKPSVISAICQGISTPTLVAARQVKRPIFEVATGRATEACTERDRLQELPPSLKQVAAYPRRELQTVVENCATHKHPAVRA